MKKILFIVFCLPLITSAQEPKTFFGKKVFDDTVRFNPAKIPYLSAPSVVHLGIDTLAGSPTYGKLVRKTASGGAGSSALSDITAATTTNTISNSDDGQIWQWNTLTGKTAFTFRSSSTAATGDAQVLVTMALTGTNATSDEITSTLVVTNDHAGTGAINTALAVGASGGATNYAIYSEPGINKLIGNTELGAAGTLGVLKFFGSTSGVVSVQPQATAGTYTMILPNSNAAGGLGNDGAGNLSWINYQTVANLTTDVNLGTSNTLYPSQNAVKTYVDNTASTIALKDAVIAATTVAGTLATSFENNDVIDGVTLATGNRILIKNQAAAEENGIYTVNASGAPTRATDFDAVGEIPVGAEMFVQSGTANSGKKYTQTLVVTTLNTDPISFVLTGGASGTSWGAISGTLSDQTDLQNALDAKQASDADLTALAALSTTGIVARTAANTYVPRTLTGTSNKITITDGDGVAGNPTFTVGSDIVDETVSNTYAAGMKQIFDADGTNADIRLTGHTSDPSSLAAGDLWYETTTHTFRGRFNAASRTLASQDGTEVFTNKRITPRTGTEASSATPTINTDNVDFYSITALAVNITSMTTNLSGTPTTGQKLRIDITGTAARGITWGASFSDGPVALPTTTVTTNTMKVLVEWDGSIWRCMAAGSN